MASILPIPRTPLAIRPATMADLPFIDALQKRNTKMVGWMPGKQLEEKISAGHVLVADATENVDSGSLMVDGEMPRSTIHDPPSTSSRSVGYVIAQDQYFKRDDVGIIYQLNVAPTERRKLIGAALIQAVFDRAAYGCRLFCCWCAQDIEANHFWESIGFIPLAFRTGSAQKGRVHIFWQRRIREGDHSTPYWFPAQTKGGSIRQDRLVLPIPPGRHWSDGMPRVLPQEKGKIEDQRPKPAARPTARVEQRSPGARQLGGWRFTPPVAEIAPAVKARPKREKVKNDPRLVAAARELRDRWLEQVNSDGRVLASAGKYEVSRALPPMRSAQTLRIAALPDAAAA